MSKIIGLWSGHDASCCVLDEGVPLIHTELERHIRIKEPSGDSIKLLKETFDDLTDITAFATCHLQKGVVEHEKSWDSIKDTSQMQLQVCDHHEAHASHAFFSSNFDDAIILSLDGGGIDKCGMTIGTSAYIGKKNTIKQLFSWPIHESNIGGVWTACTRYVFGYESGFPFGHQAGTVMALSALGDPMKYLSEFRKFFTSDLISVTKKPVGHVRGTSVNDKNRPRHPFLGKYEDVAKINEQEKFDMAASFQRATEEYVFDIIKLIMSRNDNVKNLCLTGGVALNSVMAGKIKSRFPQFENVYIPPCPHDGGLTIGAAQWVYHQILENERINWDSSFTPYLGRTYNRRKVEDAISEYSLQTKIEFVDDESIISLLEKEKIISVFNGRAESGRRALGNRSILADPRSKKMKDKVNKNVKHRQWFRPFAPSVLRESVSDWFTSDCDSPYMGFVLTFREEKRDLIPAVAHFDDTARLQTVRECDNRWYYNFIKKWETRTGVPMLLNTSFNDREPICETPQDALKCFLGTEIDYLYFPEHGLLVSRV